MPRRLIAIIFAASLLASAAGFEWTLPRGFPKPAVPADNPMTQAKAELGRHLFYDQRISVNGKTSCATCHRQDLAFTDGRAHALGTTGEAHPRGSMSLVNVAYAPALTWANPALDSLEAQIKGPMMNTGPVELGLKGREREYLNLVKQDARYPRLFAEAFPEERDPYTLENVSKAIATFERTIVSMRSPYDRYRWNGDSSAITDSAKRGELIFFSSERAGCFQCHAGWNFSAVRYEGGGTRGEFFNTGTSPTGEKFRAPTLRNIALTAPYMHDGSIATLEKVIDHYAAGGKYKTDALKKFTLTQTEKQDLIEFLRSLTDAELLRDPRWSNPWP